ncbi:unnamed protein product [Brassica oleracea]
MTWISYPPSIKSFRSEPAQLNTTTPRTISPRLDPEGFLSPPQLSSLAFLLLSRSKLSPFYNFDSIRFTLSQISNPISRFNPPPDQLLFRFMILIP